MIEAIIFDFDGVIVDTETPDYTTWQGIFESYGVELERELWTGFIGGGSDEFDVYEHLEGLSGITVDRVELRRRMRAIFLEEIEQSPVLPGVLDYIECAKDMGLRVGLASSSSREWVEGHLGSRGILDRFDDIKGSDDVDMVKPSPELYLSSSRELGVCPGNAMAIEDSVKGVKAAKLAGLFCVAVPNPMTEGLDFSLADVRVRSLAHMPLQSLIDRANRGS